MRDPQVAWALRKADHFAVCVLCPLGDRVELRISMTDEVTVSQCCIGPEQAAGISNAWLAALTERGWCDTAAPEPS